MEYLRTLNLQHIAVCLVSVFYFPPVAVLVKGETDMKPNKRKRSEKAQERSERFWREIMGQNKQILKRGKGGAYKRK
jgi:hypothetical protein